MGLTCTHVVQIPSLIRVGYLCGCSARSTGGSGAPKPEILVEAGNLRATDETKCKRKRSDALSAREPKEHPAHWEEVYTSIQEFRALPHNAAPVDAMGCERLADVKEKPKNFRWQTLVSLMLSSQTKDTVTAEAVSRISAEAKRRRRSFSAQFVHDIGAVDLDRCIDKVGFHNRKTVYLQKAAKICLDLHGGDIPDTLDGLVALPGVGPKMAYLALNCAWGCVAGIGVDTHVHRISNRLGWVNSKTPEETRKQLENWLPKDLWRPINPLLVGFGQIHCLPRAPRCASCPVEIYCPGSERDSRKKGKTMKVAATTVQIKYESSDAMMAGTATEDATPMDSIKRESFGSKAI